MEPNLWTWQRKIKEKYNRWESSSSSSAVSAWSKKRSVMRRMKMKNLMSKKSKIKRNKKKRLRENSKTWSKKKRWEPLNKKRKAKPTKKWKSKLSPALSFKWLIRQAKLAKINRTVSLKMLKKRRKGRMQTTVIMQMMLILLNFWKTVKKVKWKKIMMRRILLTRKLKTRFKKLIWWP